MKTALIYLLTASILIGQNDDPFSPPQSDEEAEGESVYDFDDVHVWEDVLVKPLAKAKEGSITFHSAHVSSHRGIAGKKVSFSFSLDQKVYEESLRHPELNRGVILMAGEAKFPLLHCWLRPFSIHEGVAGFHISVPLEALKGMYVAFIPNGDGKKRYLYDLNEISAALKNAQAERKE